MPPALPALALGLVLTAALTGCSANSGEASDQPPAATQSAQSAPGSATSDPAPARGSSRPSAASTADTSPAPTAVTDRYHRLTGSEQRSVARACTKALASATPLTQQVSARFAGQRVDYCTVGLATPIPTSAMLVFRFNAWTDDAAGRSFLAQLTPDQPVPAGLIVSTQEATIFLVGGKAHRGRLVAAPPAG